MMMAGNVCRNPNCEREVLPVWWFCPHCGWDNRTVKGLAIDRATCDHDFVMEGPCCIHCGYDPAVGTPSEVLGKAIGYAFALFLTLIFIFCAGSLVMSPSKAAGKSGSILLVLGFLALGILVWRLVDLYRRPPTI